MSSTTLPVCPKTGSTSPSLTVHLCLHTALLREIGNAPIVRRINALIENIRRSPFKGIGKPEPLKNRLAGYWSRRIDGEHRLVYRIESESIYIVQARYHY